MKMKKLTALALAGVLCLGMSVTAFAADSVDITTGKVTVTYKKGEEVKDPVVEITSIENGQYPAQAQVVEDWKDEEKGSETLRDDIQKALNNMTAEEKADLNLGELGLEDEDAEFIVLDQFDLNIQIPEGGKAAVTFDLGPAKDSVLEGREYVYLMHYVDAHTGWVLMSAKVEYNGQDDRYYTVVDFESTSPVAFIINSNGDLVQNPTTPTPNPNPTPTPNPEEPTVTPDTNGSITADQLADLIVSRLQKSNTTVVRTAVSGKASPKTGE